MTSKIERSLDHAATTAAKLEQTTKLSVAGSLRNSLASGKLDLHTFYQAKILVEAVKQLEGMLAGSPSGKDYAGPHLPETKALFREVIGLMKSKGFAQTVREFGLNEALVVHTPFWLEHFA